MKYEPLEIILIIDKKEHCNKCKSMQTMLKLLQAAFYSSTELIIREIHWEEDEAIDLGIKYDLHEYPACIIGGDVYSGESYTWQELEKSIDNARKQVK